MVSKLILVITTVLSPISIIFCQVALPEGGALDVLRKQNFAVDLLSWIVGILAAIIVFQETQKKKKDSKIDALNKELLDVKDHQLKELQQELMILKAKNNG